MMHVHIDFSMFMQNNMLEQYLIHRVAYLLDCLHGSVVFSQIDLCCGYH